MVFSLCVLAQSNAVTDRVLKKLSSYSPLLGRARWIGNFQSLAVTETYPCSSQGEALTPILDANSTLEHLQAWYALYTRHQHEKYDGRVERQGL